MTCSSITFVFITVKQRSISITSTTSQLDMIILIGLKPCYNKIMILLQIQDLFFHLLFSIFSKGLDQGVCEHLAPKNLVGTLNAELNDDCENFVKTLTSSNSPKDILRAP